MNSDYINAAIKKIIDLQMDNQNPNIDQVNVQDLETTLINKVLDPRNYKIKGTYIADSQGNEIPLVAQITGSMLSKEGYPVEFDKELFYTQADGTSLGEYVECMNCHETVYKSNIFRCSCGVTTCVLCGVYSEKTDRYYCCASHKFLDGGGIF